MQNKNFYFFILIPVCAFSCLLQAGSRKRYHKKLSVAPQKTSAVLQEQETPVHKKAIYKPSLLKNSPKESIPVPSLNATGTIDNSDNQNPQATAGSLADVPYLQITDTKELASELDTSTSAGSPIINSDTMSQPAKEEDDIIELQFENADLNNFIKQIEDIFDVMFITDDAFDPIAKGGKAIKGNKISFKTQVPLSRKEAWNLFVTFLQIAGFAVVETIHDRTYRIAPIETARKLPLPAYIGTDYTLLPDTDELIRFVYFVENSPLESIKTMVDALRSSSSSLIILQEQKAFVLTDRAYNIKTLMDIIKGLDKVAIPQSVSVIKLKIADAKQVKELYDSISQSDEKTAAGKLFTRKQPTSIFFPENMRIIAEPRTNALILLGPKDATEKVENFIKKYIDKELDQPYSPLYVHQLRYADAGTIADIMNNVTQFGKDTEAGKNGGVRGIDKYMQPMSFVPEKETNRIIIKGYYDDYLKAKDIIEKLDEPQPQIAIEILLLSVRLNDSKSLGTQLRSKDTATGLLGDNIKFQTSGLFGSSPIVENTNTTTGVQRLLGNLLEVVKGASPGNTILTLGTDLLGVWGVLQVLQTITNTQVISNPFLIATNKTPAVVSLGEERRVQTATVVGTSQVDSFGKDDANLKVEITPQINSDGMIVLDLRIIFDDFTQPATASGQNNATKNVREIKTFTTVSNREVLALGGLIRNRINDNLTKVPLLADVPILGWLFKNKQKNQIKENLLVLISTRIIEPEASSALAFTQDRLGNFNGTLDNMKQASDRHDPIHKIFFADSMNGTENIAQNLLFERHNTQVANKRKRTKKNTRKALEDASINLDTVMPLPLEQQITPTAIPAPMVEAVKIETVAQHSPVAKKNGPPVKLAETKKLGSAPMSVTQAQPQRLYSAHDSLHNKKRTSLSLARFLTPDTTKGAA